MTENEISKIVLDAAITVHRELGGPGLLESYYELALSEELRLRGLKVERQKLVPIKYKGREIGDPYRLDMLVEEKVIIECKAVEKRNPIFNAQLLTYLRLTGLKLGLVINFGQERLISGYERVVNGLGIDSENSALLCVSAPLR